MPVETWIMMLLICAFVWGGFVALVIRALRSEAAKEQHEGR